ncbi:GerAB/ArcD/ProY family transporter [Clostridium ganghwense]|uniref:GerAB/ArcD/ProY family transporter n=1 Tax=Clostridium ganghwense TaxID=312089 RepID=A0ABT4CM72_9CLOT|nr:GerAB/ArcD/ProY family transporter [Clostridium ganghwense]MCY6370142.1 GerAB/ArcD/ProY family transporter [Clostridium ganghwense]
MMSKSKNESLTPSQFIFVIYGSLLGIGFLAFPNSLVKISQQDAWISTIIGVIYPLYISLMCIYISKKYPNHNILFLSKKYFGNFLGNILNLLFCIPFIVIGLSLTSGYANIMLVYSTKFLTPLKLIIVITAVCLYSSYKGISLIGKICEIIFYITLPFLLIPLLTLKKSSILNIFPILGSGITNILKGSIDTMYSYIGLEFILLIHPYMNDKSKLKSSSLIGVFLTMLLYVWIVFITIYYFGIDVTSKNLWPFLAALEIIDIPMINNFRYFFILSWSFLLFRCLTIYHFAIVYILKDFMKKTDVKKIYFFIFPIFVFLSTFLTNELTRRNFLGKVTPIMVIFLVIYVSSIALLVRIKG